MIPVLSRAEMRAFDAHAISDCHVPSLILMENAGRGAADVIVRDVLGGASEEHVGDRVRGARVLALCGTGNNGGDGFVVARHLLLRGAQVDVWLVGDAQKLTRDALANMDAFAGVGGRISPFTTEEPLASALVNADVVVDALFGIGLDRPLAGDFAKVVALVNAAPAVKVALDVPSGMDTDTGLPMGRAVVAQHTVTFAHPKLGHYTPHGAELSGHVRVVDIGVPAWLRSEASAVLLERNDVRALLVPRPVSAHKYRVGHVAVFAGSAGKIGASLLCARGALRGGAGAATIVTWPESADALDGRSLEIMTSRIDAGATLNETIDAALIGKRAVVMGPGFGTNDAARSAVAHVLATWKGPMIFDADALSMHAKCIEVFAAAEGRAVLTPHEGELARLLGTTSEAIAADRFVAVRAAAQMSRAVVVLKGAYTLIASPDGRVAVNGTGNAVLATAGSGDVLAGLVGALLCSLSPFEAACAAVHLHGAAGDAWRAAHADRGMLASDIADALPDVFGSFLSESARTSK